MYVSEKEFGQAFMQKAKKSGLMSMRIESASTISGCPDMWLQGSGDDWFVELKRVKSGLSKTVRVPWRPGQQGWALKYKANHQFVRDHLLYVKHSWTAVMLDDVLMMVRMAYSFAGNMVSKSQPDVFLLDWKSFDPLSFLRTWSYMLVPLLEEGVTYRKVFDRMLEGYLEMWRPGSYDIDVPPADDLVGTVFPEPLDRGVDQSWFKAEYRHVCRYVCETAACLLESHVLNGMPAS